VGPGCSPGPNRRTGGRQPPRHRPGGEAPRGPACAAVRRCPGSRARLDLAAPKLYLVHPTAYVASSALWNPVIDPGCAGPLYRDPYEVDIRVPGNQTPIPLRPRPDPAMRRRCRHYRARRPRLSEPSHQRRNCEAPARRRLSKPSGTVQRQLRMSRDDTRTFTVSFSEVPLALGVRRPGWLGRVSAGLGGSLPAQLLLIREQFVPSVSRCDARIRLGDGLFSGTTSSGGFLNLRTV
jgi:hypothetical protein